MGTPITGMEDPVHGAVIEIISAMSALNMEPRPLEDHELEPEILERKKAGDVVYLSQSDGWASHAMKHLETAADYCHRGQHLYEAVKNALAMFDVSPEQSKKILELAFAKVKEPLTTT